MKNMDFISYEKLKDNYGLEDFEIQAAVDEEGLHLFNHRRQKQSGVIYLRGKGEIRPNLPDCIFKKKEVENIWGEPIGSKKMPPLTYNAMLNQPVFKKTMAALKEVLDYYEKNRPGKRAEAIEIMQKKKYGLPDNLCNEIIKTIPTSLKRKLGQRDR